VNFIIFDLEATCWRGRPPKGITEIIEIGAVKVDRFGHVAGQFSEFVKPIVNPQLSGFCTYLTHIEQKDVDHADKFEPVCRRFMEWAEIGEEEYMMCSWGHDDFNLLSNDCKLHKMEYEWVKHFTDLKRAYQRVKKIKNASGLKSTVKKEGFEFTGIHHRAISDAENLAKVFIKYFEEWDLTY
jgi:inhibitor of KinA sporulation pathway (predicted exonuclease)